MIHLRTRLHSWFLQMSSWHNLAISMCMLIAIGQFFNSRSGRFVELALAHVHGTTTKFPAECGNSIDRVMLVTKSLDSKFGYSGETAVCFARVIGEDGCRFYGISELTADMLFPLTYCFMFGMVLVRVFSKKLAAWLIFLPCCAAVFDFGENVLLAWFSLNFDQSLSFNSALIGNGTLIAFASAFTQAKQVFFVATLLSVGVGAFQCFFSKIFSHKTCTGRKDES